MLALHADFIVKVGTGGLPGIHDCPSHGVTEQRQRD